MDIKKTKIEFTDEELNVILSALGQLPYIKVKSLIDNIMIQHKQINEVSKEKTLLKKK